MTGELLKQEIWSWLGSRSPRAGETVEFSWFILRVIQEPGGQLGLETLDFQAMASFTTNFDRVAAIFAAQGRALAQYSLEACPCMNCHAAMVSNSYAPGHPQVEMFRLSTLEGSDSGWYVGVAGEPPAIDDPLRAHFESTYELTIHDPRLAPFWLFPVGYAIAFRGDRPAAVTQRPLPARAAVRPWWKFW